MGILLEAVVGEVGFATPLSKDGQVVVNVELTPICSSKFRPGKPPEEAQKMGSFLNSLLENTKAVALDKLKIGSGVQEDDNEKHVWYLFADIYCLNYDGNLMDACLLALMSALMNTQLPQLKFADEKKLVIDASKPKLSLQLNQIPLSLTFGIIEDCMLCDVNGEEESLEGSSLTIIHNQNNKLCSILKSGSNATDQKTIKESIQIAIQRNNQLNQLMKEALSSTTNQKLE